MGEPASLGWADVAFVVSLIVTMIAGGITVAINPVAGERMVAWMRGGRRPPVTHHRRGVLLWNRFVGGLMAIVGVLVLIAWAWIILHGGDR